MEIFYIEIFTAKYFFARYSLSTNYLLASIIFMFPWVQFFQLSTSAFFLLHFNFKCFIYNRYCCIS